jgi:tetratricopeptide (TPR) repeat protein
MNKKDSQQMQAVMVDIDEEFRARVNHVFDTWLANKLDFDEAKARLDKLRQDAQASSNPTNEACVDNILGVIYGYRSNFEASIAHFAQAIDVFEKHQAWRRVASCSLNIGENYRLLGNFARAQHNFHRTHQIARRLNDLELQAVAITNEGLMLVSLESYARAKVILEEALTLILEQWHPEDTRLVTNRADNLCEVYYALAQVHLHENNLLKALKNARHCLSHAQENERPFRMAHAYRVLGDVVSQLKILQIKDAETENDPDTYYQASLDAFKSVNADSEWAKTLFAQGKSLAQHGKTQAAKQNFQQAMLVFNKLSMWQEAAQVTEAQIKLL